MLVVLRAVIPLIKYNTKLQYTHMTPEIPVTVIPWLVKETEKPLEAVTRYQVVTR
jgi:hypothetical protein